MIRLLIVDDHPVVRAGLAGMLSDEPGFEVVGEAADGDQATRIAAATRPDVVLIDLRMPGVGGVEATAPPVSRARRVPRLRLGTVRRASLARSPRAGAPCER
ncbi:response regulator transcription factor [Microbacterium invictum]|uniref:response regulator transcription factor n=1 Tax=Microbacterium invictum TaxID=515415 RepID=UPI0033739A62